MIALKTSQAGHHTAGIQLLNADTGELQADINLDIFGRQVVLSVTDNIETRKSSAKTLVTNLLQALPTAFATPSAAKSRTVTFSEQELATVVYALWDLYFQIDEGKPPSPQSKQKREDSDLSLTRVRELIRSLES